MKKRTIANDQLQLAFDKLCELRDMAPLVFKGMQVVKNQPDIIARKKVLNEQTVEILRRRA